MVVLASFKPTKTKDLSSYSAALDPHQYKLLPKPSAQNWDQFEFLNKVHHCWNGPAVLTRPKVPKTFVSDAQIQELAHILQTQILDTNFLDKLLQNLRDDHNISHEEANKLSKQNELTYGPLADSVGINLDGLLCQGGNNGETFPLLVLFIGDNVDWPETRSFTNPFGTSFSPFNAKLIQTLSTWLGTPFIKMIQAQSFQMAVELSPALQATAAEIFAGVLRSCKSKQYDAFLESTDYLTNLLTLALNTKTSQESGSDWGSAVRWGASNMDPRKLEWMQNTLLKGFLTPTQPVLQQIKQVRLCLSLIEELSWRGLEFSDQVLKIVSSNLSHSLQLMRKDLAALLCTIISSAFLPHRNASGKPHFRGISNSYPLHHGFLAEVLSRLLKETRVYKETILSFTAVGLMKPEEIDFYLPLLYPCMALRSDSDEDVKTLSKKITALACQIHLAPTRIDTFIAEMTRVTQLDNWHLNKAISPLLQIVAFNHRFLLSHDQFQKVFSVVNSLLAHSRPEVQGPAKDAIASLLITQGDEYVQPHLERFRELLKVKLPNRNQTKTKEGILAISRCHEGLLGLSGLIKSQPYDVPLWLPSVLVEVTEHLSSPPPLNKTASDCLKEFWRTHTDEWIFFQRKFTADQVATIRQTSTLSYYA